MPVLLKPRTNSGGTWSMGTVTQSGILISTRMERLRQGFGNFRLSNGVSENTIGSFTFRSDGQSSTEIGDFHSRSNGNNATDIGQFQFNTKGPTIYKFDGYTGTSK